MTIGTKGIIFWVVMLGSSVLAWAVVTPNGPEEVKQLSFSEFAGELDRDNVRDLTIVPGQSSAMLRVTGFLKNTDSSFSTVIPSNDEEIYEKLSEKNVHVVFRDTTTRGWLMWAGNGLLPTIVLVILGVGLMYQIRKSTGRSVQKPEVPD